MRYMTIGMLLGFGLSVVYLTLAVTFPPAPDQLKGPLHSAVMMGGWPRHIWVLLALLVAPPVEEFVFRGVLFAGFSRSWGPYVSGLIVTVVFVALHALEISGYWPALLAITTLALAALYARIKTNSLAPAIVLHASYNLLATVGVYAGTP